MVEGLPPYRDDWPANVPRAQDGCFSPRGEPRRVAWLGRRLMRHLATMLASALLVVLVAAVAPYPPWDAVCIVGSGPANEAVAPASKSIAQHARAVISGGSLSPAGHRVGQHPDAHGKRQ